MLERIERLGDWVDHRILPFAEAIMWGALSACLSLIAMFDIGGARQGFYGYENIWPFVIGWVAVAAMAVLLRTALWARILAGGVLGGLGFLIAELVGLPQNITGPGVFLATWLGVTTWIHLADIVEE